MLKPIRVDVDVGAKKFGSVNADWNQNDPSANDYIKNRPCFIGDSLRESYLEQIVIPAIPPYYLTFSGNKQFSLEIGYGGANWDGTMEYSLDKVNWDVWDGSYTIECNSANKIYLRGINTTMCKDGMHTEFDTNFPDGTGIIDCSGNIEVLLDYNMVMNGGHPIMGENCFTGLFANNPCLRSAPSLPATTLSEYCYAMMFNNCTSLVEAPELPATRLAVGCYNAMFTNCTSLASAPQLPATILVDDCYEEMFAWCESLVNPPALPATTLGEYCYASMFFGCGSLTTLPSLPATSLASYCYDSMFYDCASIKLSETSTAEYTKPYRIPTIGTGSESTGSLHNMFIGTGGTFVDTPEINRTYYLWDSNTN